ncbi:MAG TPA: 2Fe-2S iron-sulfur cluster-binding protein [Gemmataceae bacterium]|nr:2Fe-2S iron-sulfur cluster-binding protein [Gemmataceae bacterium]
MPSYAITLVTPNGETHFDCDAEQFVLHAALEQGIELPYSCLQGWCITCAARLLKGQVDQSASRRFYPQDAAAGFALLCTGCPRSDLKILTHQKEAMRAHRIALGLPVPRGS